MHRMWGTPITFKKLEKIMATDTTSKAKKAGASDVQKLRIRVRAYEHKILDASVKQIIDTACGSMRR